MGFKYDKDSLKESLSIEDILDELDGEEIEISREQEEIDNMWHKWLQGKYGSDSKGCTFENIVHSLFNSYKVKFYCPDTFELKDVSLEIIENEDMRKLDVFYIEPNYNNETGEIYLTIYIYDYE